MCAGGFFYYIVMNFTIADFKSLTKKFLDVSKFAQSGDIDVSTTHGPSWSYVYTVKYRAIKFKTWAKFHACSKIINIPTFNLSVPLSDGSSARDSFLKIARTEPISRPINKDDPKIFKTLRLVPEEIPSDYKPHVIAQPPLEYTEAGKTYRMVTRSGDNGVLDTAVVAHSEEPIYDYLDCGFFLMTFIHTNKVKKEQMISIVANTYDINTSHIFAMCRLQPELVSLLKNSCFINVYDAEMTRLRMHKKLNDANKTKYASVAEHIDNDYKKNTTLLVLGKLLNNDIEKTTIQNITLTKDSAVYERVNIVSPDLLSLLYSKLNFNGEFDVYAISNILAESLQSNLDTEATRVAGGPADSARSSLPTATINGIPIIVSVSVTGQRYVNSIRINRDEIAQAVNRASCYHDGREYNLFLKSISRMSIRYHDILTNGLKVKIHEMSASELKNEQPDINAPSIKFRIDAEDKRIKLEVSPERLVKVNLGRLIQRVETINKKTDGKWFTRRSINHGYNGMSGYRNAAWAAEELVDVLISTSTFEVEEVSPEGVKNKKSQTLIKREDIISLLAVVNQKKSEAIERSKQFLQTAVDLTKAEKVVFLGKAAYKVQGSLRSYAVIIASAKVYDYETKQYRCIVNDRHYEGVGYDDIATRLLALKNDSVMQESISTLRGVAQPQYEGAYNYVPERETTGNIENIVDVALANKS